MTDTIAEMASAISASSEDRLPADVATVFAVERLKLTKAGLPNGVLTLGEVVADVDLLDAHKNKVNLFDVIGDRLGVIVFYRGDWCPYCNLTLRTYQAELWDELARRNVALVAVSPQLPDGALNMRKQNDLTFPVLSDSGGKLASQVGIVSRPSTVMTEAQLKLGLDVAATNADGTASIPMPTVLILNADRSIKWVDVHPDFTTRTEVIDILVALDQL